MRFFFFLPLLLGFSGPVIADSKIFKLDVSAESYRNYTLSGMDRNGSLSGSDPTVTVNKIKEIQLFLMSMHPAIRSI